MRADLSQNLIGDVSSLESPTFIVKQPSCLTIRHRSIYQRQQLEVYIKIKTTSKKILILDSHEAWTESSMTLDGVDMIDEDIHIVLTVRRTDSNTGVIDIDDIHLNPSTCPTSQSSIILYSL